MRWSDGTRTAAIVALLGIGVPTSAHAQSNAQLQPADAAQATIEELMQIRVTSAARKEQRAEDVPAAVYVITREDIRRSGLTILPELFRLVPGMQIAQINANKWAVSVRGFNDLHANKLLVLIDGRSVYNRVFSGVMWDAQDVMISDIERIEVIRGPGGAVWGANAVNGIINIITRSAADTKGARVDASLGTFERDRVSARYGGAAGGLAYRVYSQWSEYGDARISPRISADDRWNSLGAGFRMDLSRGTNEVMLQGNFLDSSTRSSFLALPGIFPGAQPSPTGQSSDVDEKNVLGRWKQTRQDGSILTLQAFQSNTHREDSLARTVDRTSDVDVQYQRSVGSRHDVVLGGGARHVNLSVRGTPTLSLGSNRNIVFNTFVQDEITLGRRVSVTLGSKLEHDEGAGWGVLPTARALWQASPRQRVWAGVSRARRTPSSTDLTLRVNFAVAPGEPLPILVGFTGNPDFRSEELTQTEAGYRLRLGSSAELELTTFRGRYSHLGTAEPQPPVFELTPAPAHLFIASRADNLLNLDTTGVEVNGSWAVFKAWRIDGSYSGLRLTPHRDPTSLDANAARFDGNAPAHQWQLHSSVWFTPRTQLDAAFYRVGRLRELDVPAYSRVDVRFERKLSERLSAIATGQNLSSAQHQEFSGAHALLASSMVPRSGRIQLRWQY